MRIIACLLSLLLLSPHGSAQGAAASEAEQYQTGYCPQTHALKVVPQVEYWFEGTIGKSAVRMYIDRGGDGVVGLYYATAGVWTPTLLGGEWGSGGISLTAESDDRTPKGQLQGRIEKNTFIGSWTATDGKSIDPVRLTVIPKPACDGKGPWKRFVNPKWPLSFSYPASWQLQQKGDYLQLTCPDPEAMAYNSEVTVEMGTGKPRGSGILIHCPSGWRYGSLCDCSNQQSADCRIPKITRHQDKAFLNLDDTEWRVYCRNGGYIGQGYGEHRVVLFQNDWMEIYGTGAGSVIVDPLSDSTAPAKTQ